MYRSTPHYIIGTISGAACLVLSLLDYRLAAVIAGFIAFFLSTLAVKNGGGNLAIYTSLIVSTIFGYSVFPGAHYFLPVSMFILAIMPCIRPILFKSIGNAEYPYLEAFLFAIGLGIFISGSIHYH